MDVGNPCCELQVRGTLEAALKTSLKRGSSQRSSALKSALARAETLLQDVTGGESAEPDQMPDLAFQDDLDSGLDELETSSTDATSRVGSSAAAEEESSETSGSSGHQPRRQQGRFAAAVSQILRMVGQARKQLEADNEERLKAEQQAAEEQRQRKERQKLDKEKRLAEVKEKTSKAKLEKERLDKQKAERREADRAERLQTQRRSQEERQHAQVWFGSHSSPARCGCGLCFALSSMSEDRGRGFDWSDIKISIIRHM